MTLESFIEGLAIKAMNASLNQIAEDARNNASWSSEIPDAISVRPVRKEGNGVYVGEIVINLREDGGAPQALAFEFGSGIHGEDKQTYEIRPRNPGGLLAFEWDKEPSGPGPKFVGHSSYDNRLLFRFVDHPGVAKRPFIAPAVAKNRKSVRSRLARVFSSAYREFVPRVTVIE